MQLVHFLKAHFVVIFTTVFLPTNYPSVFNLHLLGSLFVTYDRCTNNKKQISNFLKERNPMAETPRHGNIVIDKEKSLEDSFLFKQMKTI